MLKEISNLAAGMLVLHGHVTDPGTVRLLAAENESSPRGPRGNHGIPAIRGRDWRIVGVLTLLAAIWGGSFLFQRVAAPDFGPLPLVEVRMALGALVLLPFLWRERARFNASRWGAIVAIGALTTTIPFSLFAWSAERAPAGIGAISNSMAVPFAALTAFVLFGERIGRRRAVALLAGLAGVAVLASGHVAGAHLGAAVAAGTLAALLYGVSANLVKRHLSDLPPAALAAATMSSGAVTLAPFAVTAWPSVPIPLHSWIATVLLGVLCTGTAYALYFNLIRRVGAPRAATVTYLVPAFGVTWGWLFLGEPLTPSMALGGALILGGLLFGQREAKPPVTRVQQPERGRMGTCADCG